MPKFSKASFSKLATCDMDLQVLFFEIIKHRDCIVLEGYRGKEAQNAAYAAGNSQLQWPNGQHNKSPSHAVDIIPYPINWNNKQRIIYFAGFVVGIAEILFQQGKMKHKIRWGGDFNKDLDPTNGTLADLPHYEIIV